MKITGIWNQGERAAHSPWLTIRSPKFPLTHSSYYLCGRSIDLHQCLYTYAVWLFVYQQDRQGTDNIAWLRVRVMFIHPRLS